MESIRVVIPDEAAHKLRELAERDYRAPRGQAAVLLIEAIEHAMSRELAGDRRDESGDRSLMRRGRSLAGRASERVRRLSRR